MFSERCNFDFKLYHTWNKNFSYEFVCFGHVAYSHEIPKYFYHVLVSMTPEKRNFVKKLAHGVRDLMEYLKCDRRIGINPQSDLEKFIKRQLLIKRNDNGYEFSVGKFRIGLDVLPPERVMELLIYLDQVGVTIDRAFTMASPNPLLFNESDQKFVKLINDGEIKTFYHFLVY
jgi:hypothetical protein